MILDNIVILGSDINLYDQTLSALEALKKSGKNIAIVKTHDEFQQLENKIGVGTRIGIFAHGMDLKYSYIHNIKIPLISGNYSGNNELTSTEDFFRHFNTLNNQTWVGVQVHLWSCYSGRAIHAASYLPSGAVLITHGPTHFIAQIGIINKHLSLGLQRQLHNPFAEYFAVLMNEPEDSAFAFPYNGSYVIYNTTLPNIILTTHEQTTRYLNDKATDFKNKLKEVGVTPEFNETNQWVTQAASKAYREEAIAIRVVSRHPMYMHYIPVRYSDMRSINDGDCLEKPVIFCAIETNNLGFFNLILSNKVDINIQNGFDTPLIVAAKLGKIGMVKRLLQENNIQVDKNREGMSALVYAAINNQFDIVKTLLLSNADPTLAFAHPLVGAIKTLFEAIERATLLYQGIRIVDELTRNNLLLAVYMQFLDERPIAGTDNIFLGSFQLNNCSIQAQQDLMTVSAGCSSYHIRDYLNKNNAVSATIPNTVFSYCVATGIIFAMYNTMMFAKFPLKLRQWIFYATCTLYFIFNAANFNRGAFFIPIVASLIISLGVIFNTLVNQGVLRASTAAHVFSIASITASYALEAAFFKTPSQDMASTIAASCLTAKGVESLMNHCLAPTLEDFNFLKTYRRDASSYIRRKERRPLSQAVKALEQEIKQKPRMTHYEEIDALSDRIAASCV